MEPSQRFAIAERLRAASQQVAEDVTTAFLAAHPDWLSRYGDRARQRGVEDARYHVTFLAAAVESGAPGAFADYARWTARVLEARGIERAFLAENLRQVEEGLSARVPGAPVQEYVSRALQALQDRSAGEQGSDAAGPLALTRSLYLQAILAGERTAAVNIVNEAMCEGASGIDVYVDVLQAALYEVGRLWEANRITVAHEHAASAITQLVAAHVYGRLDRRTAGSRGTLLITGLEGEMHSVGASMVADVLEADGWTVHFLGTSLPHQAILDAIRERQPSCVGISATMLFNVRAVRRLVDAIRMEWGTTKRVVVGGSAFRHVPGLWREIGADGYAADLRQALEVMCE